MKKDVLLYLGKFPGFGNDVDGGSILAQQLIDSLKNECNLDVVFIRKNKETFEDPAVRCVRYVEYLDARNNKFIRRLENLNTNKDALKDYRKYDRIVTAHVSKFFGFDEKEEAFWEKTILFPMFCTQSYVKAGELVPEEYTSLERIVLNNSNKIITPSRVEKNDLITTYGCDEQKIKVIPRGISPCFHFKTGSRSGNAIKIVYIASIKPQKNNIDAVKLLKLLRDQSSVFELHLVCTLQDQSIYQTILAYIEENNLAEAVHFHIGLCQSELAELLQEMDINISVSNWETFGRGIYEGISSGLPTFVMKRLIEVEQFCRNIRGVQFVEDISEMAAGIISLCKNGEEYQIRQQSLKGLSLALSYQFESQRLLQEILYE